MTSSRPQAILFIGAILKSVVAAEAASEAAESAAAATEGVHGEGGGAAGEGAGAGAGGMDQRRGLEKMVAEADAKRKAGKGKKVNATASPAPGITNK